MDQHPAKLACKRARSLRRARRLVLVAIVLISGYFAGLMFDRAIGNVPIRFYGRLLDTNGRPVAGQRVDGEVTSYAWSSFPIWPRHNGVHLSTVTDDDGNFTFSGHRGRFFHLLLPATSEWEFDERRANASTYFSYPRAHSPGYHPPSTPDLRLTVRLAPRGTRMEYEAMAREAERRKKNAALDAAEMARREAAQRRKTPDWSELVAPMD